MELRQNKNFLPVYKRSNVMWRETSEKRVVLYRLLVCFSCTNRLLSCKNEKALIFFAKLLCFYNIPIAWHFLKKYGKRAEICIEVFSLIKHMQLFRKIAGMRCCNRFGAFWVIFALHNLPKRLPYFLQFILQYYAFEFIVYLWKRRYRQQRRVYWCSGIFSPRVSVVIVFIFLKIPNKESLFEGTW